MTTIVIGMARSRCGVGQMRWAGNETAEGFDLCTG
jgi:hypothetical protein